MRRLALSIVPAALTLAACGDGRPAADQVPAGTEIAENGVPRAAPTTGPQRAAPTAAGAGTAFGLTTRQLEDADLVDGAGAKLGEVERVETDAQGNVNALVVEIEGQSPDRKVRIPLTGLSVVPDDDDDDDWNLRSADLTRERLIALPEVR